MERREHAGTFGWIALAAGVAAFDYLAPETLSHAVDRALERPHSRYMAIGAVAITACHLLNVFDSLGVPNLDPFQRLASLAGIEDR